MVFNFPPLFLLFPLKPLVPPLITPFTPPLGTKHGVITVQRCASVSVCYTVGGRYLLIVAILQDTKLGLVMSAMMSPCQSNRSVPLARRSDRWDGIDLCESGQDKAASLSSFALSLCEELPVVLTTACSFARALARFTDEKSILTAVVFLLCLPRFCLHLPLTHTHTQVLIMSNVSE